MTDWSISKPEGQCSGTGRKIEPGEEFFAALIETSEGFTRCDYCPEYWHQHTPDVFCYWKTTLPEPGSKKQLFVDDEMLIDFFDRLEGAADQSKINFRFVLALILMRKRMLKYSASRNKDGVEIWSMRVMGENKRNTEVIYPNLNEEQIEQLTSQIGQVMQLDEEDI